MIRKAALLTLLTAVLAPAGMAGTAVAASNRHAAGSAAATAAAATAVAATAPADPLVVEKVTPEIPREAATPITVSGAVTGTPQSSVQVRIHYSPGRPFATRAELATFLDDDGYVTTNWRTKIQVTQLDQSGKLPFEFSVTPQELGMSRAGVYPLAIEVLDAATGQRVAIDRTVLPYVPADAEQIPKVRLALAMPIVDRPHRADDNTFMDDDLRGSVASGRLANLLKLVKTSHETVTWFVDPALLEDVRLTSAGSYTVKTSDGIRRAAADPAAGKWLDDLRTALSGKPVLATPYADPDLAALVHNKLDEPAVAAIRRGSSVASDVLGREVPTSTTWPAGGRLDRDTLDELAMSGVKSVLLSGDAFLSPPPDDPGTAQTGTPQTGAIQTPQSNAPSSTPDAALRVDTVAETPVTALLADPALGQILGADVSAAGGAMLARQRFLGETAMIAFEGAGQPGQAGQAGQAAEPGRAQPTRTVVAVPETRTWNPNPAFVSSLLQAAAGAPWLRMTSLDSVKPTRAARSDFSYTDQDRQAELRHSYLGTVRRLGQEADAVSTVTTEQDQLFHEAILRLTASAWRTDRKRAHAFAKQVESSIEDRLRRVSVIDTPRAVAGADGQVPVSVANKLDSDVTIKIRVTSDDESRLAIVDGFYETEPITVLRDRTQLVNVPVTVPGGGGGEATISIQVLTAEGKRYGKAVHVTVRTTDYTGIAIVIVGAALVIMLAAVVMRVLRRRSRRAFPFGAPDGGPAPPDATPSDAAPPGQAPPGHVRAVPVEVDRGDKPPA
ncbi:DUF6049 family protein [Sphaerimonospora thailandensis]|uniref:Secreted protein n=1 Tax=Sphaerimonospora thailandensis TaxID=795644 RepID=A0A8J3RCC2_9ACTN|nr:DUF6049 family protein [Sphaerimonospora thailandensis]GIH71214.1 hypothetical protein Mth01_34670 [Sphaerimonospora thailandensis]